MGRNLARVAGRTGAGLTVALAAIALAGLPAPRPAHSGHGRGHDAAARPADAPPGRRQRATTAPAADRASDRARERARGWPFRAGSGPALPALQSPLRVAPAADGTLLVSDYTGRMILAVARDSLEVVGAMPVGGRPAAVAVVGDRVLVGNESRARVEVYGPDGQCLDDFDAPVWQPNDMAVSAELGLVFVVATQEKVVKVFDLDGVLVDTIPAPGQEPLGNPTAVAVESAPPMASDLDGDGTVDIEDIARFLEDWGTAPVHVLVSDYGDPDLGIRPAVRIYDEQGNDVRTIRGRFSRPQGLATDGRGRLFVVDAMLGQVLVVDQFTGELITTLGEPGLEPGQLRLPLDVVVDRESKDVFVTNNRLRRVEAFREGAVVP